MEAGYALKSRDSSTSLCSVVNNKSGMKRVEQQSIRRLRHILEDYLEVEPGVKNPV